MRRREFVSFLVGAAAARPLGVAAQPADIPVIGFFSGTAAELGGRLGAFREGVRDTGFVEGRNVAIEYRYAGSQLDRLPEMAAELVRRPVTVLVPGGIPAAVAAKAA